MTSDPRHPALPAPSSPTHVTVTLVDDAGATTVGAAPGDVLLDVIRKAGKILPASCGGTGTCGKCTVTVVGHGRVHSCQHRATHDCRVQLPGRRKARILTGSAGGHPFRPHDAALTEAVEGGVRRLRFRGQDVWSGPESQRIGRYGLAVDIGTTTVVVYLMDLSSGETMDAAGFLNPQSTYGADVVSRIGYASQRVDGTGELQRALIAGINDHVRVLCVSAGIDPGEIHAATVVGNTTMLHFFLGVNASSIGMAPYTPVFVEERTVSAESLGVAMNPAGAVRTLPCLAGYVGADIVAGVATTPMAVDGHYSLLLDIGTNGEMACGNRAAIHCCSTAAGPAFEGARIACGVVGVEGAIAHVRDGVVETIGNVPAVGICGSGLLDAIAMLLDKGLVDMSGYMERDHILVPRSDAGTDHDIVVTPHDVREVQLGKAAIRAGVTIMLKEAGIAARDVARVYLAGGFGSYLDPASALRIGLLPPEFRGKVIALGNSAGLGAQRALRAQAFDEDIRKVVALSRYVELSMRRDFNEEYANAMLFE